MTVSFISEPCGTQLLILYALVVVVGFEQLSYTVNETNGFQEVCVQVFNPPSNEELVFSILLQRQSRFDSAGTMLSYYTLSLRSFYSNRSI